jgi:hypothetical protein
MNATTQAFEETILNNGKDICSTRSITPNHQAIRRNLILPEERVKMTESRITENDSSCCHGRSTQGIILSNGIQAMGPKKVSYYPSSNSACCREDHISKRSSCRVGCRQNQEKTSTSLRNVKIGRMERRHKSIAVYDQCSHCRKRRRL